MFGVDRNPLCLIGKLCNDTVYAFERTCRILRHRLTVFHRAQRLRNQFRRIAGRFCRICRKATHFIRYNSKSLARHTGSCRLYRGIQRENIGLERNIFDILDDLFDPGRAVADFVHCAQHLAHLFCTQAYFRNRFIHAAFHFGHGLRILIHLLRYAHQGSSQFLNAGSLLSRALTQRLRTVCHLLSTACHLTRRSADLAHNIVQDGNQLIHCITQPREFTGICRVILAFCLEITICDRLQTILQILRNKYNALNRAVNRFGQLPQLIFAIISHCCMLEVAYLQRLHSDQQPMYRNQNIAHHQSNKDHNENHAHNQNRKDNHECRHACNTQTVLLRVHALTDFIIQLQNLLCCFVKDGGILFQINIIRERISLLVVKLLCLLHNQCVDRRHTIKLIPNA